MNNLRVIGALGARAILQTIRRPQLFSPILIFPTLLLAIQTGGAGRGVDLPGFPPVNSFLDFIMAGAMIQSTLLAANSGGIALAVDIEMGFTDRLLAAPIPPKATAESDTKTIITSAPGTPSSIRIPKISPMAMNQIAEKAPRTAVPASRPSTIA